MIDSKLKESADEIISSVLGLDASDITPHAHFLLDFNATLEDMERLHDELEAQLDLALPTFSPESPITVEDLYNLLDDSSL
jgi:acyl carrier protein